MSWVWKLFGAGSSKDKTSNITVPKYVNSPNKEVNLATALQYGTAQGIVPLQKFIKEFSAKVYQPAYENWTILLHGGNTDAWTRAILTLCNSGDFFIVEEWAYPSALASALPFNIHPIAVAMDSEGLRTDALRKTLAEWDEEARGARRPHVIYTVPVGQNPSGAVMNLVLRVWHVLNKLFFPRPWARNGRRPSMISVLNSVRMFSISLNSHVFTRVSRCHYR